ncbi:MAG: DUF1819 family protein [Bacteroidales bacterium]|nr:DUF1819 family protein [Bacteroidales bacterium]
MPLITHGNSPYKASITREQYLFYEMRATAKLLSEGLTESQVIETIVKDNLFQYPTEKSVKRMATLCVSRLKKMKDQSLISAIAEQPTDTAKQICLYAMMKDSKLVLDFMMTVIGEKYRLRDFSFGRTDLNVFFMRLQEQDEVVASWSDQTITKIKQVLTKILVENDYLDSNKAEHLNSVLICALLENAIHGNNDESMLPAFNCFE